MPGLIAYRVQNAPMCPGPVVVSIITPLPAAISMKVNRIFFDGKRGRLPETAAMEVDLKNLKEKFSLTGIRIFGADLHPGPTHAALRQIFAISRNLRHRHLSFRWARLVMGAGDYGKVVCWPGYNRRFAAPRRKSTIWP
jgi:hypothetical protein